MLILVALGCQDWVLGPYQCESTSLTDEESSGVSLEQVASEIATDPTRTVSWFSNPLGVAAETLTVSEIAAEDSAKVCHEMTDEPVFASLTTPATATVTGNDWVPATLGTGQLAISSQPKEALQVDLWVPIDPSLAATAATLIEAEMGVAIADPPDEAWMELQATTGAWSVTLKFTHDQTVLYAPSGPEATGVEIVLAEGSG